MKRILPLLVFSLSLSFIVNAQVYISEIMYNTPGFDDEWVEITNDGSTAVDITGYQLTDSDGSTVLFTFPATTTLAAGGSTVIAVGDDGDGDAFNDGNTSTPLVPFIPDFVIPGVTIGGSTTTNQFGNSSGTVALLDASSTAVSTVTYSDAGSPDGDGDGNSFSYDSSGTSSVGTPTPTLGGAIVPVELTSFTTSKSRNAVELNWATASEINNDHFIVEHSKDGVNFSELAKVEGNGTTNKQMDYAFTHKAPSSFMNYYRLKQVDYDGAYEYSDLRSVSFDDKSRVEFSVFPTVTDAQVTIQFDQDLENASLVIYNIQGQLVYNNTAINGESIDISTLIAGTYTARLITINRTQTARFIKL